MQIAIELPDEWAKNLDVTMVAKELVAFVTAKYAVQQKDSTTHSDNLDELLKDVPFIQSLADKDPLKLQQEMRNEWR
jgi:hypothetical protein